MPGPALFRSTSSDPEPCQRQPPLLMPWSVHVTAPAKSYSNTPAPRYRENSRSEPGASHFSPGAGPPPVPAPLSCPPAPARESTSAVRVFGAVALPVFYDPPQVEVRLVDP